MSKLSPSELNWTLHSCHFFFYQGVTLALGFMGEEDVYHQRGVDLICVSLRMVIFTYTLYSL